VTGSRRATYIAAGVLFVIVSAAILAPFVAPYDPIVQLGIVKLKNQSPSSTHLFGTDQYSRDVLSRVIYGARVSLSIGVLSVAIAMTVGTVYGAIAGYVGGRVDNLLMRLNDALLSIPRVLLLLGIVALWESVSFSGLVWMLGFSGWFGVSRLVRAEVLSTSKRDFVLAARSLGVGHRRILVRHILPHIAGPVLVAATFGIANVILIEAGLSFLGVGIAPPDPSWGNIIQDGTGDFAAVWWISLFPGLALVATTISINVLADGLREALSPRQLPAR
jgi:peptide/nickel transport system permease protein